MSAAVAEACAGGIWRVCLLVAVTIVGCGPRPPPAPAAASEILAEDAPPPARLRPIACSYGGRRRLTSGDPSKDRAHVIAVVEIASEVPLRGLKLAAFELLDASGEQLTYAMLPVALRLAPDYVAAADPLTAETRDFDGRVMPGTPVRVWIHATLDAPLKLLLDIPPARFRATFDLEGGRQVSVDGRVGELWSG